MNIGQSTKERRLSATFVALADSLVTGYDVVDLMQQLTSTCVELLHCDGAGLLLADPDGHLRVMASSSEQMRMLELFEIQNSDGPCLECFRQGEPVSVATLADSDDRWPHFAPAARAAGFSSVQALPLRLREQTIGALNLFFTAQHAMVDDDVAVAQALADVATIGILQERALHQRGILTEQLQRALTNRLIIEQAKGVLAERGSLAIDAAFTVLRDYCRHFRLATSEVAGQITNGTLNADTVLQHQRQAARSVDNKPAQ
jgi:GAF domain-containing protein